MTDLSFAARQPIYAQQWQKMVVNESRRAEFEATAKRLYKQIDAYKQVEAATRVPAAVVAVIDERECDGSLADYLGNGQPLGKVTTIVPKGKLFYTFLDGAIDALQSEGSGDIHDWCVERAAWFLEFFNGPGYAYKGLPSPYLWGGTNIQQPGKYVSDDVFDPNVMDVQEGCMPLLAALFTLDPTLTIPTYARLTAPVPPPKSTTVPLPRPRPGDPGAPPMPAPATPPPTVPVYPLPRQPANTRPTQTPVAYPILVFLAAVLALFWHDVTTAFQGILHFLGFN